MKQYIKYLCAVLLVIGTSAHAWGTNYTLVTSVDQLNNGDVVVLGNQSSGSTYLLTRTMSNGVRYTSTSAVTVSSSQISTTAAMELRIKFNNAKTYCAFCIEEGGTAQYPTYTWIASIGTSTENDYKNKIREYVADCSFDGMTDITSGGTKYWSWGVNYD